MHRRKKEEAVNDHLITASRRRDVAVAVRLLDKMKTILLSPGGAWADSKHQEYFLHFALFGLGFNCVFYVYFLYNREIYWKLDVWEDDSRRRKRFVANPYLCRYSVEKLKTILQSGASAEEVYRSI